MTDYEPKAFIRPACFFFSQGFCDDSNLPYFSARTKTRTTTAGPKPPQKILQDPVVQDGLILEDRLNEAKWLGFFRQVPNFFCLLFSVAFFQQVGEM